MRLILAPLAWWDTRRIRRAARDFRRANFYATRGLRTMMAVGSAPLALTASGVPAIPPLPSLYR